MSQLKDELEEHAFLVEADEWLQGLQEGPQPRHLQSVAVTPVAFSVSCASFFSLLHSQHQTQAKHPREIIITSYRNFSQPVK